MKKIRLWRIAYAVCCLVYMGWIMHVGTNEFNRINSQYHRITAQFAAGRIRTAALEELAAECRSGSALPADREEDACSSWPPPVVEAREAAVTKRLVRTRERAVIKLVLFYAGFALIFLLGPPVLIYLLLAGILALYKNIKIVR